MLLPEPLSDPDIVRPRPDVNRWFRSCGIDLMLYPVIDGLSFEAGLPYLMAIPDLRHRLQPEFPEVSANGEWEWFAKLNDPARARRHMDPTTDPSCNEIVARVGPIRDRISNTDSKHRDRMNCSKASRVAQ